ncbi:glycosyltransferase [Blastopirellula marina]|uniref:Glycosyltransferase n=1 Tax=Blastopirellula marina DSM 3645 TaxID=314230 RepID=A3ZWW6_9BACT|nr:glycosyltransferase [Blastopirellula marina]EAQ79090.1 hypothetical protein DSM3645_14040 [Blastopirellula marina DSM 3645]
MPSPEIAVIISTFQRPQHLRRSLESLAMQRCGANDFEVVVTDDGSRDETEQVVAQFAEQVDFPVAYTTHPHDGFQLAKCRNEGVSVARAPYILFLDGDLVAPPDFVAQHLNHRRRGFAMVGDSIWLNQQLSESIDINEIRFGDFRAWATEQEERRMRWKSLRAEIYSRLGLPDRPRMKGGNIALWRDDYETVNGYDQDFVGWGLEDSDLQRRLYQAGVRFRSSMRWTRTHHLWHARDPSYVARASGTDNEKLMRANRPSRCSNGLAQRDDMIFRRLGGAQTLKRAA